MHRFLLCFASSELKSGSRSNLTLRNQNLLGCTEEDSQIWIVQSNVRRIYSVYTLNMSRNLNVTMCNWYKASLNMFGSISQIVQIVWHRCNNASFKSVGVLSLICSAGWTHQKSVGVWLESFVALTMEMEDQNLNSTFTFILQLNRNTTLNTFLYISVYPITMNSIIWENNSDLKTDQI